VITETLRMGNVIIGVMRKAMKDVEIKGYLIPKGWCVFTYFRSVHLDENHYEWPYKFNPWRWQVRRAPTFLRYLSSFVHLLLFLLAF
jgi:3-epi-6-deoxocathasterone 23-monooxygenase